MIRLRKNRVMPKQLSDTGAFIFVVVMIPFTYFYEVQVKQKYGNKSISEHARKSNGWLFIEHQMLSLSTYLDYLIIGLTTS